MKRQELVAVIFAAVGLLVAGGTWLAGPLVLVISGLLLLGLTFFVKVVE